MARDKDYDTPRTPPATPPVIDPDAKPVPPEELAKDGDRTGDIQGTAKGERADPAEIDVELLQTLKTQQAREGAGEQAHDAATPETLLPPD
ncbi:hypothetical protein [Erythrobacter sp.]|jgi:hypothetical protein|uniref:hypothetical protein n=1 Tax=Erythrobacter sp. TaxID=1042 RepID=UPI002EBC7757|nr:hypothetical protein [Erythrobacter sp.]